MGIWCVYVRMQVSIYVYHVSIYVYHVSIYVYHVSIYVYQVHTQLEPEHSCTYTIMQHMRVCACIYT